MPTVTPLGSGSGSVISSRQTLVEKVCALKGFSDADPSLVVRVEAFLDDTIKDLNTFPWTSTITSETFTLTQSQQYITLNPATYKTSLVYLVNTTTGDSFPLIELPYVQFKRQFWKTDTDLKNEGQPSIYTLFNYEKDRRMQFNVAPDSSCATNYRITVEYYKRLPLITSVQGSNSPDIPDYFENAILYGAYKRICAHVGDQNGITIYEGLEKEAKWDLRKIDSLQPDATHRFMLVDVGRIRHYPLYGLKPFLL